MDIDNIQGFIIRSVDYGDTSKILTLFTKERGIISVMARGVKKPKSKKINLVSLFNEVSLELIKKNDFYFLRDGEIIETNEYLKKNIKNIYLLQLFFDIIERTIIKEGENPNIYLLLKKSILYFSKTENIIRLANMFLIKYISMIGFKPHLNYCAKCGVKDIDRIYFSISKGGIVCSKHRENNSILLDNSEYNYLKRAVLEIFENIDRIDDKVNEIRMFNIIIEFIKYITDISIPNSYISFTKLMGI